MSKSSEYNSHHVTKVVNQYKIFTFLKKIDQNIIIINHSDIPSL